MNRVKKEFSAARLAAQAVRRDQVEERLRSAAAHEAQEVCQTLGPGTEGLTARQVRDSRDRNGRNIVTIGGKHAGLRRIAAAFINPFTVVLIVLAIVSSFTDIVLAAPEDKSPATVIIITVMVLISGTLRLVQESRSGSAVARLSRMIRNTACVRRSGEGEREIPMEELVVGDLIRLSAGDMIPADVRLIEAKDLFISQSSLTGESEPVEKTAGVCASNTAPLESTCLAFAGSSVISGSARAVVLAVGDDTVLGGMAEYLNQKPPKTSFEKGVNSVSWVLIRFMLVMIPVVLVITGFTKGDWMNAVLFAISVAVGLTPEMLPMIVTTCLARGAVAMSEKKVIVKNLNAIQNLGTMDVLCTDKTGTITQDQVLLKSWMDISGKESSRVLRHAYLNSYYQTGLKNLMDVAIIERCGDLAQQDAEFCRQISGFAKVDEIPFDFERRRMSVAVESAGGKTQLITKGALEEMLRICSFAEVDGRAIPLTAQLREQVRTRVGGWNQQGMRVLGIAQRSGLAPGADLTPADEADMVLIGYLVFMDPPKKSAAAAIRALNEYGVQVKVLTGDNEKVTASVCRQVGLPVEKVLLGSDLADMTQEQLQQACETTTVFAKLSPSEKARVVTALRANGHDVGYMGDGINDAAAMQASDVGISVDTAVDIARDSAGVILTEKDLTVLEDGILEGRKTYGNMIKYIKMTASSNFGNMFSVLIASAFLPFLPMASIQLILLNLIYDISCTAIPWDHVDREFLTRPRKWDAASISRFMLWIGPTSSVFDIATYLILYFILCPALTGGAYHTLNAANQALFVSLFQTGWFVESMWSQTLVIHMIRTPKIPFIQSHASLPVTLLTFSGIACLTALPFTPLGPVLGLHALPGIYFAWLAGIMAGYLILATIMKRVFIRRYGELL